LLADTLHINQRHYVGHPIFIKITQTVCTAAAEIHPQ